MTHPTSPLPEPRFVRHGGIDLAVYEWGEATTGETIVLLHGYPDSAHVWSDVAAALADRFHVVAYDMRGTGRSTSPTGTGGLRFDALIGDLRAVVDAVCPDRPVHLVGHDWGALQGWEAVLGGRLEGRIASFSAAAPSLDRVGLWFREQLRPLTLAGLGRVVHRALGSSYMMFLQIPLLPEVIWRLGFGRLWPRLVGRLEGTVVTPAESQMRDALGGLGLYRTNLVPSLLRPGRRSTALPVHLLVMTRDPFVPAAMFDGMERCASNLRRSVMNAGHWGFLARPGEFADLIAGYVSGLAAAP